MYDDSVRVPFIVAGPGVAKAAKIASPIYLQDAMATALDLAGAEKPSNQLLSEPSSAPGWQPRGLPPHAGVWCVS